MVDDGVGTTAGELERYVVLFEMTSATEAGDGTVPTISGAAPKQFAASCVKEQLAISGIDHQGAYKLSNDVVLQFLRYSICKITADAK